MSDSLSIFQKIGIGINQIVKKTAKFSRAYVSDYCPIVGVADKHSVFQDNSSLISIIKINGTTKLLGDNEKKDLLEELRLLMQSSLRDENAAIQLVFQRDKVNVKNNLEKLYSPLRGKAKALRMNLDPIITDRINRILPLINEMDVYCVVYTYPMKLVSSQAWKDYIQERLADAGPDYPIDTPDGIQVYMTPDTVLHRHNSVLKSIENGLNNLHLSIKTLDAHECVYLFRTMLFPDETSDAWKARLPGDHIQPRVSQMQDHIKDNIDAYICPSIGRQIAAGSVDRGNGMDSIIRIGSRFVSTHVAKLLPAKPKSFEYFLEHVADLNIPIRFSFTMLGGADFWKGKLESIQMI